MSKLRKVTWAGECPDKMVRIVSMAFSCSKGKEIITLGPKQEDITKPELKVRIFQFRELLLQVSQEGCALKLKELL
jgi:hypothetical protein